jgi:hypothetical protein
MVMIVPRAKANSINPITFVKAEALHADKLIFISDYFLNGKEFDRLIALTRKSQALFIAFGLACC